MSEDVRVGEVVAETSVVGEPDAESDLVGTDVVEDDSPEDRSPEDRSPEDPVRPTDATRTPTARTPTRTAQDGASESDNPLDGEAEIAADYLEELLDIADLDGDIDTYIEGDRAHVSVITDSDVLVGRGGEVLDALQELTRLAVMTETGERSRLMLDVAGYRDRRRKELVELTASAVAEVKDSGERLKLSPMNPFERKIVHDAVAEAGLTSESEGEEPSRCVVIIP